LLTFGFAPEAAANVPGLGGNYEHRSSRVDKMHPGEP
jgi:hypothetical protein